MAKVVKVTNKTLMQTSPKTAQKLTEINEKITVDNVQNLGERIAVRALKTCLNRAEKPPKENGGQLAKGGNYLFMNGLYLDLITDIKQKAVSGYALTDAYDIAQTATAFLCEHLDKYLHDTLTVGNKSVEISVLRGCFRAVNRYIMSNRQKQYKQVYLDDYNGNELVAPPLWDMPKYDDLAKVIDTINAMKLSSMEKRILHLRLQGFGLYTQGGVTSNHEIARHLGISRNTVIVYLKRIQAKYNALQGN